MNAAWFLLICRECGDGADALVMPFATADERSRWAGAHTRGTGHDRWFVFDEPGGSVPVPAPQEPQPS